MHRFHTFSGDLSRRLTTLIIRVFHPKSIRKLFFLSFLLLMLLFSALYFGSTLFFSSLMRDQVYDSVKETMELYNNELQQRFRESLTYLSENCIQNTDIAVLGTTSDPLQRYVCANRIQKMLSAGACSLSTVGGLFIYSANQDIFIPYDNERWDLSQNNLACADRIKLLLRDFRQDGSKDSLNFGSWFMLPVDDDCFLVRILKTRNTYAGVWINFDKISSAFKRFEDIDAHILYVDTQGRSIGDLPASLAGQKLEPEKALEQADYYRYGLFSRYLTVSVRLDNSDYYILALIPASYTRHRLMPLYMLMSFIFVLLLLFAVLMISNMTQFFNTPSRILSPVIDSLRSGNFDSKVESPNDFREIQNITDTFNTMIGEIQNLRIHIYEAQIARKELELQYLKTQVAPHFLINCLNTVFVLSQDVQSQETAQQLIRTLSEHLRYTLAMRSTSSLREELYHVQNYLTLTQLRFPETVRYNFSFDPEILDAQVFPLILLMLTENSIKANVVVREPFAVRLRGQLCEGDGRRCVHLVHIDSGPGFDEEKLELYNHITEHPETQKKGSGIGLYNTAMRLRLVLGDSASIRFSNEPGWGARVDIRFPYIPHRDPEEKDAQTDTQHTTGEHGL